MSLIDILERGHFYVPVSNVQAYALLCEAEAVFRKGEANTRDRVIALVEEAIRVAKTSK